MDRLVAGDVGYGKTEVALRAAFKAVADGRQVAVLVPTTVLAQQHCHTFSDRFGPFPAQGRAALALPQRPRSRRRWSRGCARATVDVVIGTHRLLSKDVTFKNLGLLVDRRGAPLRRRPQGAHEAAARLGGRADADRHADPAHAVHGALRRARPVGDRDAAARPAAGRDHGDGASAGPSSRRRSSASWSAAARSSSSTTASSRSPP